MNVVLAIIITWLVGPVVVYTITRLYRTDKMFPASLTGAVGDTIFLPTFNGSAVYYGLLGHLTQSSFELWSSVIAMFVFSTLYLIYRKNIKTRNDWMRTTKGHFNFAGWYHFVYVIVQSFIVFISLLYFYNALWLWVTFLGYMATTEYFRHLFIKSPN